MPAKYQLYYSPGACSLAVHALLHEINQPLDLIKVDLRAPRDEAFLKVSPRGQVPALVEDSAFINEGGAILVYLCDKYNSDLLPKEGIARAQALEALMFCNATLHPATGQLFKAMAMQDAALKETIFNAQFQNVQKLWDYVEEKLSKQAYLAGDKVTIGDILLTVIANWAFGDKRPNFGPNTKRLLAEISTRPAYQMALEHEGVEYKAAA